MDDSQAAPDRAPAAAADADADLAARFFARALDLLCVFALDGTVQRVNPAAERAFGAPAAALVGRSWLDLVHPDDRAATAAELARLAAGTPSLAFSHRVRAGDGAERWLSWTCQPARDEGRLYAVGRDVSVRRAAAAERVAHHAATASERDHLSDLLRQAPAAIAVTHGRDHVFALANPPFAHAVGRRDAADLLDRPLRDALPELEAHGLCDLADWVYATGEPFVADALPLGLDRERDGDGRTGEAFFRLTLAPFRDEAGAIAGLVALAVDVSTQARAHQTLAAERGFLRQCFQQAPVAIAVVRGPDHIIELTNPGFTRVIGDRAAAGVGRRVRDVVPEAVAQGFIALLDRVYERGEPYVGRETPITLDRGAAPPEELIFDFVFQPLRDARGAVDGVFALAVDVTAQVRARQDAETARARLATVLAQLPVGVILAEAPSGRVVLANVASERIWGQPVRFVPDVAAYTAYHGFHPDGRPYAPADWPLTRAIAAGEVVRGEEIVFARDDGAHSTMRVNAAPIRDGAGQIVAAVATFEDITGHKQADAALAESETRFRLMADTAPVLIWMSDAAAGTVYVNQGWLDFTGRTLAQETGAGWSASVHPDDRERIRGIYHAALARQRPFTVEYRLRRRDGVYRWVLDSGVPRFDANGACLGFIGSAVDVTAQKARETRAAHLQALTARLAGALTTEAVVRVMLSEGLTAAGAHAGSVVVLSDDGTELVSLGAAGYPPEVAAVWDRIPLDADWAASEAVRTRAPVVVRGAAERLARYPHLAELGTGRGDGAGVVLPLLLEGGPIGALGLTYAEDRAVTAEELHFMRALANLCAQALERARLFDRERAARAAAETAETRYRTLFAGAAGGIVVTDAEGRYLDVNDRVCDLLGYSREELLRRQVGESAANPEQARASFARLREAAEWRGEIPVRRKDGTVVTVELWAKYLALPDGPATISVMHDVTERKRAAALASAERRVLELTAGAAPLAGVLADLAREIETLAGDYLVSILLLDADGQHLRHAAAPSLPAAYTRAIDGVAIGPEVGSCGAAAARRARVIATDIATDPRWAPFRDLALGHGLRAAWSTPILGGDGAVLGTFCLYGRAPSAPARHDLALIDAAAHVAALAIERKQAETALRASEERYRTLIEVSPQVVWMVAPNGDATFLNRHWLAYTGLSLEQSLGAGWLRVIHPGDRTRVDADWAHAAASGERFEVELRLRRRDGAYRWHLARGAAVRDATGAVTHWTGILLDIHDRKRTEAQLAAALVREQGARAEAEAAVRARDEFLAIAAHELRNPVAGIRGAAQLLARGAPHRLPDPDRVARYAGTIGRAGDRLAVLVEDLLDVARLQRGQFPLRPVATDLAALVRTVAARRPPTGHVFAVTGADAPLPVVLDPGRIEQVLVNLLDNAAKYSPDGGAVRIAVARDGGGVRLTVADEGIGLPAGAAAQLFAPFGRAANATARNVPGLGLGLYICRQIVEAHGGRVWAESPGEGRGTTVGVWLPTES